MQRQDPTDFATALNVLEDVAHTLADPSANYPAQTFLSVIVEADEVRYVVD